MAGYCFKPTYKAPDGSKRESSVWWIGYSVDGKKFRESSKSSRKRDAEDLLARRLVARGQAPAARAAEQTTFEDLAQLIRDDYWENGRKTAKKLERTIGHLATSFEGWRASAIDEAAAKRHVTKRLRAGAAPATVNHDIAALKRMLRLGYQLRMVERMPDIPTLSTDNARKGFFEEADLQTLLEHLPKDLRPLIEVAYITGWRKEELLTRDWRHVDFDAGWLVLETSKNMEGRQFPLIPRLRAVLAKQEARRKKLEVRMGAIIQPVFFRSGGRYVGQRIRNPNKAFAKAREAAGMDDRIIHDFRRTAVRNLVRAGVPEKVAMELSGHKTRAVFDRYNIVNESMLRDAGDRLQALHGGMEQAGEVAK